MEPLAGWTIAVTAERRADEQAQMLEARGARVVLARTVRSSGVHEADLRERTRSLLADPPAMVVANTATGMRSWIALAWSWGIGDDLLRMLADTTVVARGTKAAGALMSEGLDVAWLSSAETLDDVFSYVTGTLPTGSRVALQCDGRGERVVAGKLHAAGLDVVEVPIYRVDAATDDRAASHAASTLDASDVDAITFTSPAAVGAFDVIASTRPQLVDRASIVCACVGPVTAGAARACGFERVVTPARSRLGPMVRALAEHMRPLGRDLALAGKQARLQGARIDLDGRVVQLTPRERTLLHALVDAKGAVVSKQTLARIAWAYSVEQHTVEVTVNRLRRKLGTASAALETTNRRGYRLALSETSRGTAVDRPA